MVPVFADSTNVSETHSNHTSDTAASSDTEEEVLSESSSSIEETIDTTQSEFAIDEEKNTSSSKEILQESPSEIIENTTDMLEDGNEDKSNQIEKLSLEKEVGDVVIPYDQRIVKKTGIFGINHIHLKQLL